VKKIGIVLIVSLLLIFASVAIYLNSLTQDSFIYPGISVNGVDISGLSVEQAKIVLQERLKLGKISFVHDEKKWDYNLSELGFEYDYDRTVSEAFSIGRDASLFRNWLTIFKLNQNNQINLELSRINKYKKMDEIYAQIKTEVDREAVDAKISVNDIILITPEQDGYEVDIKKLKNIAENEIDKNKDDIVVEIPVDITHANIKREQLSSINGVIGEFTTSFDARVAGRTTNISLASSKVDSVLLMPGQEFSFNNATGKITLAAGYKNAPVIVKGELQEGVGGGVCQVSTTLYNSVLYAGLEVLQRRAHSIPSSYVSIGRDAAVAYGALDFVFRNPHDYPIYMKAFVGGNKVTARIYGDTTKHNNKSLSSQVVERIPRQIKYINDPTLPLGKEVIDDPGRDGIKSITYETINGNTKVVSRDHYPAKTKIIKVGTGPEEVKTEFVEENEINNFVEDYNQNNTIIDSIFGGR